MTVHFFVELQIDRTFGMGPASYDQCRRCNAVRVRAAQSPAMLPQRMDLYLVDGDITRVEPECVPDSTPRSPTIP